MLSISPRARAVAGFWYLEQQAGFDELLQKLKEAVKHDRFDIQSSCGCPLGIWHGDYTDGCWRQQLTADDAFLLGFHNYYHYPDVRVSGELLVGDYDVIHEDWNELQDAWIDLIEGA